MRVEVAWGFDPAIKYTSEAAEALVGQETSMIGRDGNRYPALIVASRLEKSRHTLIMTLDLPDDAGLPPGS